jgi:hypothetical protein
MIKRHGGMAKWSGATIIPAISISSLPSDLMAWLIASYTHNDTVPGGWTVDEVLASWKLTMLEMQGGPLDAVFRVPEKCETSWFWSDDSWVLSDRRKPSPQAEGWLDQLFGYRRDGTLGHLVTSFIAQTNEFVVHRYAAAKPDLYGPRLRLPGVHACQRPRQRPRGTLVHETWDPTPRSILVSELRAQILIRARGRSGPRKEQEKAERLDFSARRIS